MQVIFMELTKKIWKYQSKICHSNKSKWEREREIFCERFIPNCLCLSKQIYDENIITYAASWKYSGVHTLQIWNYAN